MGFGDFISNILSDEDDRAEECFDVLAKNNIEICTTDGKKIKTWQELGDTDIFILSGKYNLKFCKEAIKEEGFIFCNEIIQKQLAPINPEEVNSANAENLESSSSGATTSTSDDNQPIQQDEDQSIQKDTKDFSSSPSYNIQPNMIFKSKDCFEVFNAENIQICIKGTKTLVISSIEEQNTYDGVCVSPSSWTIERSKDIIDSEGYLNICREEFYEHGFVPCDADPAGEHKFLPAEGDL